ncbi:hypothetical protein SAMN03159424_00088 [Pseudomonas sp. NFACC05-1]|nr:hypothetical protein SAMN03159424_00088 [Pseudomonas sp. NFACC05-1]
MALAHPTLMQADPPLSRASSLPQGMGGVPEIYVAPQTPCGSELDRDGGFPDSESSYSLTLMYSSAQRM